MPDEILPSPQTTSKPVNVKNVILTIVIGGLVLCIFVFGYLYFLSKQSQHPVNNQSKTSNSARKENFEVYAPMYVPKDYKIYENSLKNYFNYGPDYYEIVYVFKNNVGNDPYPFNITSFVKPSYYKPPADCGKQRPDPNTPNYKHTPLKCELVATLSSGSPLYYAEPPNNEGVVYFTQIGNTVITLGTPVKTDRNTIDKQDVTKLFNSLEKKPQQ